MINGKCPKCGCIKFRVSYIGDEGGDNRSERGIPDGKIEKIRGGQQNMGGFIYLKCFDCNWEHDGIFVGE